jgi:hypothetical protein
MGGLATLVSIMGWLSNPQTLFSVGWPTFKMFLRVALIVFWGWLGHCQALFEGGRAIPCHSYGGLRITLVFYFSFFVCFLFLIYIFNYS